MSQQRFLSEDRRAFRLSFGIVGEFEEGGAVAFIDLGDAALVLPGGIETANAEARRVLAVGAYSEGLAKVDDPDLAL